MTQRRLEIVERWPGGVTALVDEARARNVHLLQLTDDQDRSSIAASLSAFKLLT